MFDPHSCHGRNGIDVGPLPTVIRRILFAMPRMGILWDPARSCSLGVQLKKLDTLIGPEEHRNKVHIHVNQQAAMYSKLCMFDRQAAKNDDVLQALYVCSMPYSRHQPVTMDRTIEYQSIYRQRPALDRHIGPKTVFRYGVDGIQVNTMDTNLHAQPFDTKTSWLGGNHVYIHLPTWPL